VPSYGNSKKYIDMQIKAFGRKIVGSDQTAVFQKRRLFYAACSGFSGN
jgi:hypothetical protein